MPEIRAVFFRAPGRQHLGACLPRFELSGHEGALFIINDPSQPWMLASLLRADEVAASSGGGSVLDKLR